MFNRFLRRSLPIAPPKAFPTVEIFEWRPENGAINFGDHLARVIAHRLLASRACTPGDETVRPARLFTVGSVMHFAGDDDTVWGSGVNGKVPLDAHRFERLDVRAVRGPKTAAFLADRGIQVPAVYGDPALLLPHLFGGRFARNPSRKAVFVPNLHDLDLVKTDLPVISPLRGWNRVIEDILSAEFVAASSLHGIVVAEAFGIPARLVRLSDTENPFKYDDYAQGTGRDGLEAANSISEALAMGGMPPIVFDPAPLIAAFPWDLWHG